MTVSYTTSKSNMLLILWCHKYFYYVKLGVHVSDGQWMWNMAALQWSKLEMLVHKNWQNKPFQQN